MSNTEQTFKKEVDRLLPGVKDRGNSYNLAIETLNYGFIVNVGCKRFAVESREKLEAVVKAYLNLSEFNMDDLWYKYFNPNGMGKDVPVEEPPYEQNVEVGNYSN